MTTTEGLPVQVTSPEPGSVPRPRGHEHDDLQDQRVFAMPVGPSAETSAEVSADQPAQAPGLGAQLAEAGLGQVRETSDDSDLAIFQEVQEAQDKIRNGGSDDAEDQTAPATAEADAAEQTGDQPSAEDDRAAELERQLRAIHGDTAVDLYRTGKPDSVSQEDWDRAPRYSVSKMQRLIKSAPTVESGERAEAPSEDSVTTAGRLAITGTPARPALSNRAHYNLPTYSDWLDQRYPTYDYSHGPVPQSIVQEYRNLEQLAASYNNGNGAPGIISRDELVAAETGPVSHASDEHGREDQPHGRHNLPTALEAGAPSLGEQLADHPVVASQAELVAQMDAAAETIRQQRDEVWDTAFSDVARSMGAHGLADMTPEIHNEAVAAAREALAAFDRGETLDEGAPEGPGELPEDDAQEFDLPDVLEQPVDNNTYLGGLTFASSAPERRVTGRGIARAVTAPLRFARNLAQDTSHVAERIRNDREAEGRPYARGTGLLRSLPRAQGRLLRQAGRDVGDIVRKRDLRPVRKPITKS